MPYIEFTPSCIAAYEKIIHLDLEQAALLLKKEAASKPGNEAVTILENFSECLGLFLSEDQVVYDRLKDQMDSRLDALREVPEENPWRLFGMAGIYFQWASVRLKFGEYYTAGLHYRKAYKMLEENQRKHPSFLPGLVYLGLMHAAVGVIPDHYKWIVNLVGFDGTLEQGIRELKTLSEISDHSPYAFQKKEAGMVLAYVQYSLEKNTDEAAKTAARLHEKDPSPLTGFLYSRILFSRGNNDESLAVLEGQMAKKQSSETHFLWFLSGCAWLYKLDPLAKVRLEAYLRNFKGKNYVKSGYQKLGWHYFVHGDTLGYKNMMKAVGEYGLDLTDEDKQAYKESQEKGLPNRILLRARILFDGGYYRKALAEFSGTTLKDFPTLRDQLEVTYRVARINHKSGFPDKAIHHYQKTLENGRRQTFYFAANSALNLGIIFEEKKEFAKAKEYFQLCLSMRGHDYQNSIDQKAKAGLARIKSEGH